MIRIWSPWILFPLVAIGVGTALALTFALGDEAVRRDAAVAADEPAATAETAATPQALGRELSATERALAGDSSVKSVVGDANWSTEASAPSLRQSSADAAPEEVGVGLTMRFESPLESSGPWLLLLCRGTRQIRMYAAYRQITTIAVVLGHDGSVLEFIPEEREKAPERDDLRRPGPIIKDLVRNVTLWAGAPGQTVADGRAHLECPAGLNDD